MTLTPRVRANRANARRSAGPKTTEGKSRVARNAMKHRLAVPVETDPWLAPDIERLTLAVAGQAADPLRLERARRIAEAQIDLLRIRKARLALLENPGEREKPVQIAELKRGIAAAKQRFRVDDAT